MQVFKTVIVTVKLHAVFLRKRVDNLTNIKRANVKGKSSIKHKIF